MAPKVHGDIAGLADIATKGGLSQAIGITNVYDG